MEPPEQLRFLDIGTIGNRPPTVAAEAQPFIGDLPQNGPVKHFERHLETLIHQRGVEWGAVEEFLNGFAHL